jgi:hypothetical protein
MNLEFERDENGVPSGDTILIQFRIAIFTRGKPLYSKYLTCFLIDNHKIAIVLREGKTMIDPVIMS